MQSDANGLALRSVLSSHDEFIYSLIVQRWSAFRTYYGAAMPTVRTFLDLLDRNAMAHLVVTRHQEPVGFAVALGHDLQNGIAHAVVVLDAAEPAVSTVQAAELFAAYLFAHWPLRKVYWETNRIHADIAGGSESSFLLEGVYRDYVYEDSQWQDAYVLALARESPIARAGRVIA